MAMPQGTRIDPFPRKRRRGIIVVITVAIIIIGVIAVIATTTTISSSNTITVSTIVVVIAIINNNHLRNTVLYTREKYFLVKLYDGRRSPPQPGHTVAKARAEQANDAGASSLGTTPIPSRRRHYKQAEMPSQRMFTGMPRTSPTNYWLTQTFPAQ